MSSDNPRHTPEMTGGLVLTIAVHVAIAAVVLFVGVDDSSAEAEEDDMVTAFIQPTELLQWGEVMPEPGQLPNLPNPEEVEAPIEPEVAQTPPEETTAPQQEVVALNQEPADEPPEETETELRQEEEEHNPNQEVRTYRGETNNNRPTNEDQTYGSSDGFVGGTSLSPDAVRNLLSRIQSQLQRNFRPPRSLSEDQLDELSAEVVVRVNAEGQVTGYDFRRRSGNPLFDAAVESMLGRFRIGSERLDINSISDEGLRRRIETEGFRVPISAR